ncbi:alpha/beta-hydrolase [Multifurca ochricompacta]|uniref:Alpha/beta-hydrolase n=1 Tax=Multifurca ochricompacta TaxID=376703 RepID=A0AAD4M5V7_9AGAM|nr:alpha/beta-hydrolase [Multifurca ochricompacta]
MSERPIQQQWPSFLNPATCVHKGLCPVTKLRGQHPPLESHSLYYEQHGTGPIKVVFIMGLNVSTSGWAAQVEHFGRLPQYSILVFDNRGVGNSDTPMGPYSTSGMAEDVIVLLDFLGWTEKRALHLVGLSLGGMIAQELSYRIPERFISLTLGVTTAGGLPLFNVPPWLGFKNLLRTQFIRDPKKRVPYIVEMCFNDSWLGAKAENDPEGRTNREIQIMLYNQRAAVTRIQKPLGALSQMWAGFTHHVQPKRLVQISKTIPKVLILTGDQDHLIRPSNSAYLKKHMAEAEYVVWKDTGHVVSAQHVERFNAILERVFLEGQARLEGSS